MCFSGRVKLLNNGAQGTQAAQKSTLQIWPMPYVSIEVSEFTML